MGVSKIYLPRRKKVANGENAGEIDKLVGGLARAFWRNT